MKTLLSPVLHWVGFKHRCHWMSAILLVRHGKTSWLVPYCPLFHVRQMGAVGLTPMG
jgi:hypothetical protein